MDHSKITAINATIAELRAHLPLGPAADLLSRLHRELASALVAPKVNLGPMSALGSIDKEFAEDLAAELKKLTDKDEPS